MAKNIIKIFFVLFLLARTNLGLCQEENALTQEEFAVKLVRSMGLDDQLPAAALPSDCVSLLERLGISPLTGWDRKALLSEDDFTVLVAKAVGKEQVVHIKAAEVCHKKIDIIDERWQENQSLSLEALLNNEKTFPEGVPQCPYGLRYEDKNNDHKVDQHYHSIVFFIKH